MSTPCRAEITQCTEIASLPTTITTPGIYCLRSHFNTNIASGSAVTIATDNVILDLNGHKICNAVAGPGTTAIGVYSHQRKNITIRNGTIRGFLNAVALTDVSPFTSSRGHVVEDVRADDNAYMGISVAGGGSVIRRNHVVETGGSLIGANAYGIYVFGPENRVIDNDVVTVTPTGSGHSYGIWFAATAVDSAASGNRVTEAHGGIYMHDDSIKYRDNVTTGVLTPYFGGMDVGNND
jgi:hypothetical protein